MRPRARARRGAVATTVAAVRAAVDASRRLPTSYRRIALLPVLALCALGACVGLADAGPALGARRRLLDAVATPVPVRASAKAATRPPTIVSARRPEPDAAAARFGGAEAAKPRGATTRPRFDPDADAELDLEPRPRDGITRPGRVGVARPDGVSRPERPTSTASDPLWGVSGEAALHLEEGWCPPGVVNFANCDPRPGTALGLPTPRVPVIDDDAADAVLLGRADWENDLSLKPFRLRFTMPPRAVPQATVENVVIEAKNPGGYSKTQTFEWYEVRQMLSFIELFPPNVCAPDPNVCRPCVTAENSAGVEHGAPALDDPATCVDGRRCLRAGEVPFWWYNGIAPGPLFRIPTDLKWRNALKDAQAQQFVPPVVVVRQANDLPADCAGGATTHDELECKRAITSTHHHGSHSLPGFDGWADDVTKSGEWKDYVYAVDMGPRTNWYHDHGIHNTGFNVANGLFAMFPIYVPPQYEDGPHGERILPRWIDGVCNVFADGPGNLGNKEGRCFEFPMILSEARFNNEGGQTANGDGKGVANVPAGTCRVDYEIEGNIYKADVITVNKLPWPKMKVFAGYKYRGRVLGASISRSYRLSLSGGNGCAKMIVVGTDTELLLNPVVVKFLDVNSGERYQVVFDFSNCVVPEGKKKINVHLRNANDFLNNEDYLHTDKVMRFQVRNPPAKIKNAGQPSMLASDWEGGGGVPCALDPSTMTGENAKICANAKLVPDAAPTWYKNEDVCLLSENDALLRREAVQTALRALDVVRGVEPDAYGETRVREITESRPASVDISATFSADDPKTNPNGFATLSDACHGASGQGEMTTTHAKLEVAGAVGPVQCVTVRTLIFARTGGEWVINDKTWRSGDRDAMGRIEAAAQYGCLEVWHIITGGGGWHHPVHLHLIDAWIVERKDGREDEARKAWPEGRGVFPYETGSKDVFFVGFNEHVTIAFFADSNRGNYMFHCHNLIHEDDDMLLAFTVTRETYDADAVPVSKDLVMQPPFDPRFPYQTKVTPGESTKSQGQDAHRYLFPRSTQPDGANSGLVTASGYMFEYEKLWQVQSPIRDHQVEATAAIKEMFENGGKGRTGKYYEEDGKFYASGERNVAGDLLLGEDTEPSQKNRNGDIEEMFFSRY